MKKYMMTFVLLMCIAFCFAGCRKTKEEGQQDVQEQTLPSQEEASGEDTQKEDDGKTLQYQETIEMELGEDQEGAIAPAE